MTSDEIRKTDEVFLSTNRWLKEVALQLALLNEKPTETRIPIEKPKVQQRVK